MSEQERPRFALENEIRDLQEELEFKEDIWEAQLSSKDDALTAMKLVNDELVAQVDKLLRFINGVGMSDQLKAFCVKESSK